MRKFAVMAAVLGIVAATASAGLTPMTMAVQPMNVPHHAGSAGVWNGTTFPYADVTQVAAASNNFSVTFAFHNPFIGYLMYTPAVWSVLKWDNTEIEITGVHVGPAPYNGANNLAGATTFIQTAIGSAPGTTAVGTFVVQPSVGLSVLGSSSYAFMKVDYHVRAPIDDGLVDLVLQTVQLAFASFLDSSGNFYQADPGFVYAPNIASTTFGDSFGVAVTPEPASLSLLGIGLATAGVGVWRRRRA